MTTAGTRLKIAQIAPPWFSVPPTGYGGIEWVVYHLTQGLLDRGHEVTLFANGESQTRAPLRSIIKHPRPGNIGSSLIDVTHATFTMREAADFDIIHDHSGYSVLPLAPYSPTPVLHTLHGEFNAETNVFYRLFSEAAYYVSISRYQQTSGPPLRYQGTVYNSINVADWPLSNQKDDYLLSFGRICEVKGTHLAVAAAKAANRRLILAGPVQEINRRYFESAIKPHIDGEQIIYLGEVSEESRRDLFCRAAALVFPILWPEPFGLVMIEAMAAGTPVLAFRAGAVPEVVLDGHTGFIVENLEELVEKIKDIPLISARDCRAHAVQNFSVERMVASYEELYFSVLEQERLPRKKLSLAPAVSAALNEYEVEHIGE